MKEQDMEEVESGAGAAPKRPRRSWTRAAAFGVAGLLAGGVLAGSLSAAADSSGSGTGDGSGSAQGGDPSQPQRPGEQLLTGTKKEKVRAAALAEYPGATVLRIETDSDGVYEAHLLKADGQPVTVEVDGNFEVTGTELFGGHGAPGGLSAGSGTGSGSTA